MRSSVVLALMLGACDEPRAPRAPATTARARSAYCEATDKFVEAAKAGFVPLEGDVENAKYSTYHSKLLFPDAKDCIVWDEAPPHWSYVECRLLVTLNESEAAAAFKTYAERLSECFPYGAWTPSDGRRWDGRRKYIDWDSDDGKFYASVSDTVSKEGSVYEVAVQFSVKLPKPPPVVQDAGALDASPD
jgi:hypothetical protein